jgi:hypothetical protein
MIYLNMFWRKKIRMFGYISKKFPIFSKKNGYGKLHDYFFVVDYKNCPTKWMDARKIKIQQFFKFM